MTPKLIAALEDARVCHDRGEGVDWERFRDDLGDDFERFCALVRFEVGIEDVIEPKSGEFLPRPMGDYTLLRELGRGAMGVVYDAYHEKLDRRVALKTLRPDYALVPELAARYEREARACARVRHPNLVEIYEVGECEGRPYYVMPRLAGGSLSALLADAGRPPVYELCERMAGIAEAVGAMHEARIVHRDIKPANICVESDGSFVLADFGLARRTDAPALTQDGHVVGTPHYMSPEQLAGRPDDIDGRADVYALGATLYHALSGRPPFEAATLESLYAKIVTSSAKPLRSVAPGVPESVSRVVMKCLQRRPDRRYATARALATDLRRAVQGSGAKAPRIRGRCGLGRRVPYAVGVLLLVGLAVWWGLMRHRGDASQQAEGPVGTAPLDLTIRIPEGADLAVYIEAVKRAKLVRAEFIIEPPRVQRLANTDAIQLVYPRGMVRIEDLDQTRLDVGEAFEGSGSIVFRDGQRELARVPFDASETSNELPVPAAVRAAARPGREVTWSFEPDGRGTHAEAKFRIVGPGATRTLTRVDEFVAPGQGKDTRSVIRSLVLLDHGLGTAAFRAVEHLRSPAAAQVQVEALRVAYGSSQQELQRSHVWQSGVLRLEDLGLR